MSTLMEAMLGVHVDGIPRGKQLAILVSITIAVKIVITTVRHILCFRRLGTVVVCICTAVQCFR